jgi:hypothetical protein
LFNIAVVSIDSSTSLDGFAIASSLPMNQTKSQSDQLEERLIQFAASVVSFSPELPRTPAGRHISLEILRDSCREPGAWQDRNRVYQGGKEPSSGGVPE